MLDPTWLPLDKEIGAEWRKLEKRHIAALRPTQAKQRSLL